MIEAAVILSGIVPALAGLFHHPPFACFQRRGGILGRHQAGNAIAALKAKLAVKATV